MAEHAFTPLSPNDERMGEGPVLAACLSQDAEALLKTESKSPAFDVDADALKQGDVVRAYAAAWLESKSSSAEAAARGQARLALILARLGATDDAIDHANEATANGEARLARAWILWSRGLTTEALAEADAASQASVPPPSWLLQEWSRFVNEPRPLAEPLRTALEKETEVGLASDERLTLIEKRIRAGFYDAAFMELSSALSQISQASSAEPEVYQLRFRRALRLRREAVLELLGRSSSGRVLPDATSLWQLAGTALRSACDVVPSKEDWELVFRHWLQASNSLPGYDFGEVDISGDLLVAEKGSGVSPSWRKQLTTLAESPAQRLASAVVVGLRRLEASNGLDFLQFDRLGEPLEDEQLKALEAALPELEKRVAEVDAVRAGLSVKPPPSGSERHLRFSVARLQFRLALAKRDLTRAAKGLEEIMANGEASWVESRRESYAVALEHARFDALFRLVESLNKEADGAVRQRDLSNFHLQASAFEFTLAQRYGARLKEPLSLPDGLREVLKAIHNLRLLSRCVEGDVLGAEDELKRMEACTRVSDRTKDVALKLCTERLVSLPWKSPLTDRDVDTLAAALPADAKKPESGDAEAILWQVPAQVDTKSLGGVARLVAVKRLQHRDKEASALIDYLRTRVTHCKAAREFLAELETAYTPDARVARALAAFDVATVGARKDEARRLITEGNNIFLLLQKKYGDDFTNATSRLSPAERRLAANAASGIAKAAVELRNPFLACLAFGHLRNFAERPDEFVAVRTMVEMLPFQCDAKSAGPREAWWALRKPLPPEKEKRQALLNQMSEGFGDSITARLGQVVYLVAFDRWDDAEQAIALFRTDFGVNSAAAKQISIVERHLQAARASLSDGRAELNRIEKEKTRYQNDLRKTSEYLEEERQKRAVLARQLAAEAEALNQSYSRGEISQYDLVAQNRILKERANQTLFNEYEGRDRARREAFIDEASRKLQSLDSEASSVTQRHQGLFASLLPNILNDLDALGAVPAAPPKP